MNAPRLVIADGHLWHLGTALCNVYPEAEEQRCWNHRIVNILAKVPKREQPTALLILRQIPYAESRQEAERLKRVFQEWCRSRGLAPAADLLDQDWDRMVSFYNYPKQQWQHLRTTNPVESPFAGLRLRTDAAKRFKKVNNAQAVIWKMLLGGRETIPSSQSSRAYERCLSGSQVCEWSPGQRGVEGESRLSLFTHLLT